MPDQAITLGTLLAVDPDEATDAILQGAKADLWTRLALPSWLRKAAASRMAGWVDGLLAVPLSDILCGAWNAYQEVQQRAEDGRYPAGTDSEVALGRFAIDSEHAPRIEIRIHGEKLGDVTFPITASLVFESGIVVIRDRRMRTLKMGTCTASGRICCEKIVLKERASAPFVLPGVIALGDGIPIRPLKGGRP